MRLRQAAIPAWLLVFALLWGVTGGVTGAAAQHVAETVQARGRSGAELAAWAAQLGSDEEATRTRAIRALSTLQPASVAGIVERLGELAGTRPDPQEALQVLHRFRRATGSVRADDDADLAAGIAPILAEDRGRAVLAMAEPLLLLRSLEAMDTDAAGRAMGQLLFMDDRAWLQERARVVRRLGTRILPALIELRSDPQVAVRRWAQRSVRELGMADPADALALEDPLLLARVVRAYANPLDFKAMPLLARMVGHQHRQVRQAARWSMERFGKNAIWQLRELHREMAGKDADRSWDAPRTAASLYAAIDAQRDRRAQTLLDQGLARLAQGDLKGMAERYDELVARAPDFARRAELAPGYAALGAEHLAADRLDAARDAFQRALRLAPSDEQAEHWRAQVAFVDAERALTHGVVDLPGYDVALAHDDDLDAAREARDHLSGAAQARDRRNRRLAAAGAMLLMLAMMGVSWRRPVDAPGPG